MRKIAFFVEGQTEQIFVNRLVRYILGPKNTTIIQKKIKGGTNVPKMEMTINKNEVDLAKYEVLIVNCGSDNRVKSEMLENFENLEASNYQKIIGLRDLYPLPLSEVDKLKKGLTFLPKQFRTKIIYFDIILAIREIESWFLCDRKLFFNLNNKLTEEFLIKNLGYIPCQTNIKNIEHPAEEINKVLQLIGQAYSKKMQQTKKVIYTLNIHTIMNILRYKIDELNDLISYIEDIKKSTD